MCQGVTTLSGMGYIAGPVRSVCWVFREFRCVIMIISPVREMKSSNPFIPTTARASPGPFMDIPLRVCESIVPRHIWVPSMKLLEFLQTAY